MSANRRVLASLGMYLVAFAVLAVVIVPLTFSVFGGFRTNIQLVESPVGFPDPWVWSNYANTLESTRFWRTVGNSVLIALLTVGIAVPAASLASFVMARYRFRGREWFFGLFVLGLLFPVAVAIIPLFVVLRDIHLLSNPLGVALPQAAFALPLSIVIMRPFFRTIPDELQDAAEIDGCGPWRFYWSVVLPGTVSVLSGSTLAVLTPRARASRIASSMPVSAAWKAFSEYWALPAICSSSVAVFMPEIASSVSTISRIMPTTSAAPRWRRAFAESLGYLFMSLRS